MMIELIYSHCFTVASDNIFTPKCEDPIFLATDMSLNITPVHEREPYIE